VLFISHNMEAIQRLCSRGMLLDRGRLAASGPIADVVSSYRTLERTMIDVGRFNARGRTGTGWAHVQNLWLADGEVGRVAALPADADLIVNVDIALQSREASGASLRGLVVEFVICSDQGLPLLSLMNVDDGGVELPATGACRVTARLEGPTFIPGRYRVNVFVGVPNLEHVDEIPDALEFEILPPAHPWRPYQLHVTRGMLCRKAQWRCRDAQISAETTSS
jgi:lipopolysaccharide transport system ATP-binding protein